MIFMAGTSYGHLSPKYKKQKVNNLIQLRNDCAPATAAVDMDVNNVRARLRVGGDLWWDGQGTGRFIVPKPAAGGKEVSAIFAGGVWLGGQDQAGNLKVAITQYPRGNTTDFWPGPLFEETLIDEDSGEVIQQRGETTADICSDWDRFFELDGDNVRKHISAYDNSDGDLDVDDIPADVLYWPGRGNPFWNSPDNIHFVGSGPFDLPDQNLGAFWDEPDGKPGIYDPTEGDFPIINIRNCEPQVRLHAKELVPDEMIFWAYNDNGNTHLATPGSIPIQMEIQVQAFAYATNDEVNDMSFLRYKLINKSADDIQDCYFAMWMDPDLGCYLDDYVGCDVSRQLAYVYNEDALDGTVGDACPGGVETYGENIPILGMDYFRGPRGPKVFMRDENDNIVLDENGNRILLDPEFGSQELDTLVELGMSSFVYTNSGANGEPPGTTDPNNAEQAYNVLRGFWPDGNAVTFGGSGYNPGGMNLDTVRYVFPNAPNDNLGWSMCTAALPFGDRRTIQATGPILLQAGGLPEELIVGTVFVPDLQYPCPDITRLQFADDIAQALFDNCFDITDGPDAPDMCAVELDRQLILLLTNDSIIENSNNALLSYEEPDLQAPEGVEDPLYRFEGYKIYQLAHPSVTAQELDDPEKAKLVAQADIKNDVTSIYNWFPKSNPVETTKLEYNSELMVNGANKGLVSSFNILNDAFDPNSGRLVNHKDYYFLALAYAYNSFEPWDNAAQTGQRRPYLEGRNNIRTYTFTPRPQVYKDLNSAYGQQPEVTRIEGIGTGTTALDLKDGEYDAILDGSADGIITYKAGNAPVEIKVIDPLNIKDGTYTLELIGDVNENTNELLPGAHWKLTSEDGSELLSEVSIDQANEQIVYNEGFSISILQSSEPGMGTDNNGAIDQSFNYLDPNGVEWWAGATANGFPVSDGQGGETSVFPYAGNNANFDPSGELTVNGTGYFTPLQLTRWDNPGANGFYVSPNWVGSYGTAYEPLAGNPPIIDITRLNNVDIILTGDKSKWSRCPVIETASSLFKNGGLGTQGDANQFEIRKHPSVDKNGNPDGDGEGMGWFPGYAIDVETGERLNVFFGENSGFSDENSMQYNGTTDFGNGDDMIWNPGHLPFLNDAGTLPGPYQAWAGGQHFIYVTNTEYDSGADLRKLITSQPLILAKAKLMGLITHTAVPLISSPLLSVEEGLIPNDAVFKVRVTNKFTKEADLTEYTSPLDSIELKGVGELPYYEFSFTDVEATTKEYETEENPLSNVGIVPNPYYAYSSYETTQFDNSVKVINLPARATVSIYSLDGKFIKQFIRDEVPQVKTGSNPAVGQTQITPSLEWDLKNDAGIPVASGVYIFHIEAPDLNAERSIKWFGVNRRFDPTGL